MRKIILLLAAGLLLLAGCSNIVQQENDSDSSSGGAAGAFLRVTAETEGFGARKEDASARTALPTIDSLTVEDSFTCTLKGTKEGGSEETLVSGVSFEELEGKQIPVTTGRWSFTLTAEKDGTVFKGTCENKDIGAGDNSLDFLLEWDESALSGTGSLAFSLDWSKAGLGSVEAATGTLFAYDPDTGTETATAYTESSEEISLDMAASTVTYSLSDVPAGVYMIRIAFYSDAEKTSLAGTWRELAVITGGQESGADRVMSVFVKHSATIDPMAAGNLSGITEKTISVEKIVTLTENNGGGYTLTSQGMGTSVLTFAGMNQSEQPVTVTYNVSVDVSGEIKVGAPVVKIIVTLKTGSEINEILRNYTLNMELGFSETVQFKKSTTNSDSTTQYLDTDAKIPVWADSGNKIIYYYIPDGYAIRMNADSSGMFAGISFASIEIAGFDTSAVTNMSRMFCWCNALESLDVSGFDTSNVTDMSYMFSNCCKLTSLDVSAFDTSKVTNMKFMFNLCSELTSLDVSNFNTSAVTDMNAMFSSCSKLPSLDLHSFDTSAVEDMGAMFVSCSSFTSLDVSSFNTSAVTNMTQMFYLCSELTSLDLSAFDTSAVKDMEAMFNACEKLAGINLSSFDTRKVTNMGGMFQSCPALTSLDLSSFDTSAVTNMYGMFGGCSALETIYATNQFVTTNVESGYSSENCFEYCTSLKGGAGTTYDESMTSVTYARIDGGNSAPGYFTKKGAEGAEPTMYEASISFVDATVNKTTTDSKFKIGVVNTGNGDVTYTSSNTAVATVDEKTGEVTIVGAGTATITATVENSDTYTYATKTASYTLTVTKAAASISYATTTVNKSFVSSKFKIQVANTGNGNVTYTSSNTAVATVDEKTGEVTIAGVVGTATITATVEDSDTYTYATKEASYTLNVLKYITITNADYLVTEDFTTSDGLVKVSFSNPSGDSFRNRGNENGWYFYGDNSTVTVAAAKGGTIEKVIFYTKNGSATLTSAPFTVYSYSYDMYTAPDGGGTCFNDWGVNKIEVYFK